MNILKTTELWALSKWIVGVWEQYLKKAFIFKEHKMTYVITTKIKVQSYSVDKTQNSPSHYPLIHSHHHHPIPNFS